MAALNDTDIVSALNEDAEHGFRLLMAKYKEGIDILSSVFLFCTFVLRKSYLNKQSNAAHSH